MSKLIFIGNSRFDSTRMRGVWISMVVAGMTMVNLPLQVHGLAIQDPAEESVVQNHLDSIAVDQAAAKAITDGISTLNSVRLSLEDDEPVELQSPANQSGSAIYSPDLMQLLSNELENARQVEELRDRIHKLIEFDRQRILQRLAESPEPEMESGTPDASQADANPVPNATIIQPEGTGEATESGDDPVSDPGFDAKKILSEPPDQLALADSLFYSGELELAYDLYRRARTGSHVKAESIWIDYQTACCLRRMRNSDGASKILREIAESAGTESEGANARWWLDHLGQKALIQEELRTFEQFIKSREVEDDSRQKLPGAGS